MVTLNQLKKASECLDPHDGIEFGKRPEITLVLESGQRIDIPQDLASKVLGSVENFSQVSNLFDGSESLEIHDVTLADEVWVLLDETFTLVEEV